MARYRGGDGHYADVECANVELERHLVLSCAVFLDGIRLGCRNRPVKQHAEPRSALFRLTSSPTASVATANEPKDQQQYNRADESVDD